MFYETISRLTVMRYSFDKSRTTLFVVWWSQGKLLIIQYFILFFKTCEADMRQRQQVRK